MTPEQLRRKAATEAIQTAEVINANTLLAVMRAAIQSVHGDGPYANGYRTAIGDLLINLAEVVKPQAEIVPVDSSNVAGIGYEAATRVLRVRYRNGSTYRYEDVDPELHAAILSSESVGRAVSKLRHHKTTKEEG